MTNDAEDWEWGKRILDDALRKVPGPGPGTLPEEDRVKYVLSRIEAIAPESDLFVACFSNDGHKLSQWRAYADNCRGYSVGFIPSSLGHVTGSSVRNVLYPHQLQTEEIQKLVEEVKTSSRYRHEPAPVTDDDIKTILSEMAGYKNPAWAEENETRLLLDRSNRKPLTDAKDSYFIRNGNLIRCVDVRFAEAGPLTHSLISTIYRGPMCRTSERSLKLFFRDHGFPEIEILSANAAMQ